MESCDRLTEDREPKWKSWFNIPPLRQYGIGEGDVPVLVEKAAQASSMKANPIPLAEEELAGVLLRAI